MTETGQVNNIEMFSLSSQLSVTDCLDYSAAVACQTDPSLSLSFSLSQQPVKGGKAKQPGGTDSLS